MTRRASEALLESWQEAGGRGFSVSQAELPDLVLRLAASLGARTAALGDSVLIRDAGLGEALSRRGVAVVAPFRVLAPPLAEMLGAEADRDRYIEKLAGADLGITEAVYGLAATGTVVLFDRTGLGDPASLLPPVHIALLRHDRILPALEDLLPVIAIEKGVMVTPGHNMILVSGPSRTADIEQVLVTGVHGPREAYLVIVEQDRA